MCRWLAYIGKAIYVDTLVTRPAYSLMEQSLHAKLAIQIDGTLLATNGDGFGLGWYTNKDEPGLFKTAEPAWSNENINEICAQIQARIFMAHIRAASTGSIQRANAHPFKYKNWIFQHNGYLKHFDVLKRDLHMQLSEEFYSHIKGTTDSETLFLLALSYGLQENPKSAIEKVIVYIRELCVKVSIPFDLAMSCAISDGKSLYTLRYSSGDFVHSQYYSTHADCMKEINGDSDIVPNRSVVVVSEPLDQSMERWTEMPVGAFATIQNGKINIETLSI